MTRGALLLILVLAAPAFAAGGSFWQPSMVGENGARGLGSANAKQRAKDCLRRSKTEADCRRRCPGEPEGQCLRRVRGQKE